MAPTGSFEAIERASKEQFRELKEEGMISTGQTWEQWAAYNVRSLVSDLVSRSTLLIDVMTLGSALHVRVAEREIEA